MYFWTCTLWTTLTNIPCSTYIYIWNKQKFSLQNSESHIQFQKNQKPNTTSLWLNLIFEAKIFGIESIPLLFLHIKKRKKREKKKKIPSSLSRISNKGRTWYSFERVEAWTAEGLEKSTRLVEGCSKWLKFVVCTKLTEKMIIGQGW